MSARDSDLRLGDLLIDECETAVVIRHGLGCGFYMNVALKWRWFTGYVKWVDGDGEDKRIVR